MATVRYIVDDVDAAISFYCGCLGFREVMHPAPAFALLVRDDLRAYRQIERDARAGRAQAAADELESIHFATPPFQARIPKLRALSAAAPRSVR